MSARAHAAHLDAMTEQTPEPVQAAPEPPEPDEPFEMTIGDITAKYLNRTVSFNANGGAFFMGTLCAVQHRADGDSVLTLATDEAEVWSDKTCWMYPS